MPVNTDSQMRKHCREQKMKARDESLLILYSWVEQMKMKARRPQRKFPKTERTAVIMSMILKLLSSAVSGPWVHFV